MAKKSSPEFILQTSLPVHIKNAGVGQKFCTRAYYFSIFFLNLHLEADAGAQPKAKEKTHHETALYVNK